MSLRRSRLGTVIIGLSGSLWSAPAHAQEVDPELAQLLVAEGCAPELVQVMTRLLAIELDSLEQERAWPVAQHVAQVNVRCAGERVEIEARATSGERTSVSVTELDTELSDRARALALAATELVDELRAQDIRRSSSRAEPATSVPTPAAERAPTRATSSVRMALALAGGVERLGEPFATVPTLALTLRPRLSSYFELVHDVEMARGAADAEIATVDLESYSLATGLFVGPKLTALRFALGVGARAGFVRLTGNPDPASGFAGERVQGFWMGPLLGAHATLSPIAVAKARSMQRYDLLISGVAELGLVAVPFVGTDDANQPVFEIDGTWLRLTAAVGLAI